MVQVAIGVQRLMTCGFVQVSSWLATRKEGFMRTGWILIALSLLVDVAKADDRAAARAIIDEAILAHGGETALAKWPLVTAITLGTFHGYERTPVFSFRSEISNHGADQWRHILDGQLDGQKFRIANVLDARRG